MLTISVPSFIDSSTFSYRTLRPKTSQQKHSLISCLSRSFIPVSSYIVKEERISEQRENLSRRCLLAFLASSGLFANCSNSAKAKTKRPYDDRRLLEKNKRMQEANNVPTDFLNFIREATGDVPPLLFLSEKE